jgi:molybdate transport system regulatory protein
MALNRISVSESTALTGLRCSMLTRMRRTVRFRVDFTPVCSIGPGKVDLLEGIERTGSLRQAARALGMSYRRAWLLLDQLNHTFSDPVSTATVGGQGGGGAALTPFGAQIVRRYRAAERAIEAVAREELQAIAARALARPPRTAGARRRRIARPGTDELLD